jgi:hypothetical protein
MVGYTPTPAGQRLYTLWSDANVEVNEALNKRMRWWIERSVHRHGAGHAESMVYELGRRTRRAKSPSRFLRWVFRQESDGWLKMPVVLPFWLKERVAPKEPRPLYEVAPGFEAQLKQV